MLRQYIQVGHQDWGILVYYNVQSKDFYEIEETLIQTDCPEDDMDRALTVLTKRNTGFTFSNTEYKMSVVCVSKTTTASQFVNTVVHEAKHVQSHICSYYNIEEDSEDAAYLIGHIVRQMYRMVAKVVKRYV